MSRFTVKKAAAFLCRKLMQALRLARLATLKLASFFFRRSLRDKHYWLLLERGNDAQDNAWHLFKYLCNSQPGVNALFAIHKTSPDYKRNLQGFEEKVIEYDSFWYYMVLYNCDVVVSTHYHTYVTNDWEQIKGSILDINGKKVFLQHGILHNHISYLDYPNLLVDLFISGAQTEYSFLKNVYGYPDSHLCYTGLARFDNLHDDVPRKQVLIMPTWRNKYVHLNAEEFEQSDFFQAYKRVLTHPELLDALERNDYHLTFYNHFEFQRFNASFEPFCRRRVQLVHFGQQRVQELLKESQILVTDYSSIYYDFTYMRKPVIFFLLNKDDFQASQYGKDYDNPEDFGDVAQTPEELVKHIINSVEHNGHADVKYLRHSEIVFPLRDAHNCERIYQRVSTLMKQLPSNE